MRGYQNFSALGNYHHLKKLRGQLPNCLPRGYATVTLSFLDMSSGYMLIDKAFNYTHMPLQSRFMSLFPLSTFHSTTATSSVLFASFPLHLINMALFLTLTVIVLLLFVVYFVTSHLVRHARLQKDYRTISYLPISRIPFVGNLHQIDKEQHLFLRLLLRLANECQQQQKGLFCLWLSIWPNIFLCTGEGLEVHNYYLQFS